MPDTFAAVTVLPFVLAMLALLGCSRVGCLRLLQRLRVVPAKHSYRPAGRF